MSRPGSRAAAAWTLSIAGALLLLGSMRVASSWGSQGISDPRGELSIFPSGRNLPLLRWGHGPMAADMAWLRAIQYYGEHRRGDRAYPYAGHLFETMTGLDPHFEQAYVFGALVLSEDAGQPEAGEALLTRGMAALPESWWLRFERGFLRFVYLDDPAGAAGDFQTASAMAGAPDWVCRFAAWSHEKAGHRDEARGMWEEIEMETDNEVIRDIARRALDRLDSPAAKGSF